MAVFLPPDFGGSTPPDLALTLPRMSLQDAVTLLAKTPLFEGVDPVRLEVLAFTATHLAFETGDTLAEQGMPADGAFLLLSGEAVMLVGEDEGPGRAARLDRGDLVGEVALTQPANWSATVRAAAPVEVLKLERDVFLRLADEFPEIAQGCFRGAVRQATALSEDLAALTQRLTAARAVRRARTVARDARRSHGSSEHETMTGSEKNE